jgi:hypothetical protein
LAQRTKAVTPLIALERGVRTYDSQIARGISAALNAPIVAFYAFATVDLYFAGYNVTTWLVSFLFGGIIPLVGIIFLLKTHRVTDFYVSRRRERILPFTVTLVSYLVGAVILLLSNSPVSVTMLMLAYIANTAVYMIITFYWKISLHAAGLAGPLTLFLFIFGLNILPVFALIGPLAWARLRLRAHTPFQVGLGITLSIALTYVLFGLFPGSVFAGLLRL